MKNKKTIVISLISIASVLALTVFGYKLAKDYQMEHRDIRIKKFEKYVPGGINSFSFNFKEAYDKNYSSSKENVTLEYLDLQSEYDNALSLFLKEKLSINQLNSNLESINAVKIPKTSVSDINSTESYYRNTSHLNSDYLYLRNDINVERLEKSDVKLLKTLDLDNLTESDKEKIFDMISSTYIDTLRAESLRPGKGNEDFKTSYTNYGKETVNNKTIVFWLSTGNEFDEKGNYVDEDRDRKNRKTIDELIPEYELIFSEELGSEVKIFVHDGEHIF